MSQAQLQGIPQNETGGERQFYPTPPALCAAVCKTVADFIDELHPPDRRLPLNIVEPSAGTGNFVRAARAQWPGSSIVAVDIVDELNSWAAAGAAGIVADWEKVASIWAENGTRHDLIIGNPSFPLAVPHIEAALSVLKPGGILAFILRLSFEEWTTEKSARLPYPRREFWRAHPLRARAAVGQRPSFDGKGTDAAGVALFVWQAGWRGRGELLETVDWR